MAIIFQYPVEYFLIIIPFICLLIYTIHRKDKKPCEPTNWPVFGMLPAIALRINDGGQDAMTQVLNECGGTYWLKPGVFTTVNILFTSDPANIHYIFTKNFANYPKGPEYRKIFEILGDGIFNADYQLWEVLRKTTISQISNPKFYGFLETSVWEKVQTALLPILETFSEQGKDVDLQDILQRFAFDGMSKLVLDYDPKSLCIDLPYVPCEKAFTNSTGPLFLRHIVPAWLKIGPPAMLIESAKAFDEFLYPLVERKMEADNDTSILAGFTKVYQEMNKGSQNGLKKFLRDTALNLILAGRDSSSTCLTWLFWLLATNPSAETKILEEIESQLGMKKDGGFRFFHADESRKLVYLHGAICESLRLFPPVALEHKAPIHADTLPSGHHVRENQKIVISFHAVGRMESVWGKDCLEFKPERWITDHGSIKHEPAYKFPAFNVGPRTCIGREMSFIQMKMMAAANHISFQDSTRRGSSSSS